MWSPLWKVVRDINASSVTETQGQYIFRSNHKFMYELIMELHVTYNLYKTSSQISIIMCKYSDNFVLQKTNIN